ncbi:PLP-dependent aminotransferase family protein [Pseudoalteromonas piscicida]|uniref:PLP-dependent aminotransferase family protein n=1 Tax=Pseudoalteromonas piscicida TaxID=43662 RepID=A0AAD0RLY6_PSEO7|nr:PLP-dependent aminotransferase family protein [Pseudoalteromonas piscicida]ASD69702.1 GntR family transcriptional regulator [Pseudoalteromonas piscicida]AXR04801.1 PLP-dependent aminotransferase family protein [Pseudoalteromonas piscicida]
MISISPKTQSQDAKHKRLADVLRCAITEGKLTPGDKLPSARKLAELHGMNRHTVMNALQNLVAEGWLVVKERSGYRVNAELPIFSSQQITSEVPSTPQIVPQFAKTLTPVSSTKCTAYRYSFAGGLPDLHAFPYNEFKRFLVKACRKTNVSHFHYSDIAGCELLKFQIRAYLRRSRGLVCDDLLICNGSQEALSLVANAFINPGDGVAIEMLGYPPARHTFTNAGAEVFALAQDAEGIKVEALARCLEQNKVKLLYLTPLHQYPTTVTLSVPRRMAIYQLCQQYGVFIIEDDYDHEFHYLCPPLQPMAACDPSGIVIYISTFSKIMFAGARVGYMSARTDVLAQLVARKQLLNHKNDALTQLAVADWMEEGGFERHLRRMTKAYQVRHHAMAQHLNELKVTLDIDFEVPQGGMAYWVNSKRDVSKLSEKAREKGIYVQCEPEFTLDKASSLSHIRLGFAAQEIEQQQAGLSELFALVAELEKNHE